MKRTKITILLATLTILLLACSPSKEDYTEKWVGDWQTTDETTFPQTKYSLQTKDFTNTDTKYLHQGTIVKDKEERNQIIISGTLLGINSSYKIPVKLSSERKGKISYTNGFTIAGDATFNTKDTIWLSMAISQDTKTEKDTIVLVKIK